MAAGDAAGRSQNNAAADRRKFLAMAVSSMARLSVAVALCAGVNAFSMMGGRPIVPQRALGALRAAPLMQPCARAPPSESCALRPMQEDDVPSDVPASDPKPSPEHFAAFEADDEGSIAKEALKAEVGDGMARARPDRAVIGEILLALEASNPTRSPATSPLLNGKWKVVYASGATPSLKALMLIFRGAKYAPKSPSGSDLVDVQDAFVTIRENQPRVEGSLRSRVLSFENTLKLTSKLEAESAVRLVETYDSAESEYLNFKLPLQSALQYKRSILVSYLDDELLVVRDAIGRPDILMRVGGDAVWSSSSMARDNADYNDEASVAV
eukprot:scaffold5558_cov131-Isochrysis_galbana.AAC.5